MKKYSKDIINLIFNVGGFALYIFSQQILLMPSLSKILSEKEFSIVVLSLTIMNIFATVVGEDLGNTRIINLVSITTEVDIFLKKFLFICSLFGAVIIAYIVSKSSDFNTLEFFLFSFILIISCIRFYYTTLVRSIENYRALFGGSILYLFCILFCMFFLKIFRDYPLLILGIGETVSLVFYYFYSKGSDLVHTSSLSKKNLIKQYFNLSLSSVFLNLSVYLDRFIIIPLVGFTAIGLYYSVSSMSKLLSLLVNPLSNWLLVKLSRTDTLSSKNINFTNRQKFILLIILIALVGLSYISSCLGLLILYPENFSTAKTLLIPISIVTAGSIISSMMKPLILTRLSTNVLLISNFIYMIIFTVLAVALSSQFSIAGFAYANAIARTAQILSNLLFFRRSRFDS
ncbi:hypothetical protein [Streptococcus pluranimalium]|uniref:hypothetical protein n=1 Tax=Streptococcus pluranimalium TaxID=82348 RepID=UPI003F66B122